MSLVETVKTQAKRLGRHLQDTHNTHLGHGHCLEAIAALHGFRDWNTLSAYLAEKNGPAELGMVIDGAVVPEVTVGEPVPLLTPEQVAQRVAFINKTGVVHATARDDSRIDLEADYSEADRDKVDWPQIFRGGSFCNVKLELNTLSDPELLGMAEAREIQNLNLKGNWGITGVLLAHLPATIGLLSIDVALTSVDSGDLLTLLRFPKLHTVWGHERQFSDEAISRARVKGRTIDFQLIY